VALDSLFVGLFHLAWLGLLAKLPQGVLLAPSLRARLAIGLAGGTVTLLVSPFVPEPGGAEWLAIFPSMTAVCAFCFGPLAGAVAGGVSLAFQAAIHGSADFPWLAATVQTATVLGVASACHAGRSAGGRQVWRALALLSLALPLALLCWRLAWPGAPFGAGMRIEDWLEAVPWRYTLAVLVLGGGVELLQRQVRTMALLAEREQELRMVIDASGGGRWHWQVDAQRFTYEGSLYRTFGLPAPGTPGVDADRVWQAWNARRHPEDMARIGPHLHNAMQGREECYQAEYRMRDEDGRWRWLISRGRVLQRAADGSVASLVGMDLDVTEQRELQNALVEAEARYTIVYQTLPDPAGITRLSDGRYLDVNDAFCRMAGMARAEILGKTSVQLDLWQSPADREALLRALQLQGEVVGQSVTLNVLGRLQRGQISASATRVNGEPSMVFVFHDMTEQLRTRDNLVAAYGVLQQAGRMARLGVWVNAYPDPGGPLYWSEVCHAIHGLPQGAPLPSAADYLQQYVAPAWRDVVREQFERTLAEPEPWRLELEIVRTDGRHAWVRVSAEPELEDGRLVRLRGVIQDIDESKRSEQRLRQSEARFAQMFQAMPYPMGLTRRSDGRYVDVNPAWERAMGYSRAEALVSTAPSLGIYTAEVRESLVRAAQSSGELLGQEAEITTRSGERRTVLQSMSAVESDGVACWLFVLHDITERKRAEQQVREREALLSLTISAAALSLWDWDLQSGRVTGDARWQALQGVSGLAGQPSDPRAGVHWTTGIAPSQLDAIAAELQRHAAEPSTPFDATWQVLRPDGTGHWVRNLGNIVHRDAQGKPLRMVGVGIDVSHQRAQQETLQRLAHHDALTGLPNRVLLAERLQAAMATARRGGRLLGVAYLDLDGFKPVNDRLGHDAGDRLLVVMSGRLTRSLRPVDCVARLGGDEFVILLPELGSRAECEQLLATLMASVSAPCTLDGERVVVTSSIGYTLYPDDEADADALLRHADQAMYLAKQAGRNRFHSFDTAHERAVQVRRAQTAELSEALAQGQFVLYLQPKVDMRRGVVVGAEALARWRHPERGLLAPGAFLHLIENTELEAWFGEWVVDSALQLIAQLDQQGLALAVSINISAQHLQHAGFADWMEHRMALRPEVPAHRLELEITESAALYDIDHVAAELERLRRLGLTVSLDDFGTGYSSLAYLRRLPLDHIKLDRSFVHNMTTDLGDRAIVQGVIGLGASFGHRIIAEGVETVEQGALLLDLGCAWAQGYCIARPMPPEAFAGWAAEWRAPAEWLDRPAA